MSTDRRQEQPKSAVLGWATYLACSWTWCIGLFLPVLLVREFGTLGFLVFAVPNVVGAALMGALLPSANASAELAHMHRPALVVFSVVTIAFHLFFSTWMLPRLVGPIGPVFVLALAALLLSAAMRRRDSIDLIAAAVVFAITVGVALFGVRRWLDFSWAPASDPVAIAALAPVCAFGFLLCPYLDLTLHRARQRTSPVGGRIAFGLGFCVLFLCVIALSYGYARPLAPAVDAEAAKRLVKAFAWPLGLYMALQIAYTVAIHVVEVIPDAKAAGGGQLAIAGVAIAVATAAGLASNRGALLLGLDAGEVIYRCFMGFYGLFFPAYVWLCMLHRSPSRRALFVCATSTLVALPLFFMGFVQGRMILLVPGVAVVLLARLVPVA
jgi:hypothetical protein